MNDYLQLNREFWNARTEVHAQSKFYDVPGFLNGGNSLPRIDQSIAGDVSGKRLLHLQCHFGLDTLSYARMGAHVCGVDLSDASIAKARELAEQAGIEAEFIASDVYESAAKLTGKFDIVYTGWGALIWLPDVDRWSEVVADVCADDGTVIVNEFHPFMYMLDDDGNFKYGYFDNGEGYAETSSGTYTDGGDSIGEMELVTFNHSIADLIQPMLSRGFRLTAFAEHDYSPYECFGDMVEDKPGEYVIKSFGRSVPYAFSAKFERSANM
ncbi:MAG: class I SAM-dependent methyltransferase [Planctomycetota bacterium]